MAEKSRRLVTWLRDAANDNEAEKYGDDRHHLARRVDGIGTSKTNNHWRPHNVIDIYQCRRHWKCWREANHYKHAWLNLRVARANAAGDAGMPVPRQYCATQPSCHLTRRQLWQCIISRRQAVPNMYNLLRRSS